MEERGCELGLDGLMGLGITLESSWGQLTNIQ
jgi:hypothetical protein